MNISEPLMFEPSLTPRMCSAILIRSDDILEEMEFFNLTLSSPLQDDALIFADRDATVIIIDTSSKHIIITFNLICICTLQLNL